MKDNKPNGNGFVVWLTGLPSSGKTTIAQALEQELRVEGLKTEILDGDEVRDRLSPDLGFSKGDREIHASRVAYVSKLLCRNGVCVIVALISPYRSFREYVRNEVGQFVEVYVKCSIDTCMDRDVKGLYEKARNGELADFTGIQDPYEEPTNPEVVLDTEIDGVKACVQKTKDKLIEMDYI